MTGRGREAAFASVAVPVPVRRLFTYRVPGHLQDRLRAGSRVRVPFGARRLSATVVEWPASAPEESRRLREIEAVLGDVPAVGPALLELTRFVAEYYLCSWGDAIAAALPPDPGRPRVARWVRRAPGASVDALPARATRRRAVLARLPADGTAVPAAGLGAAGRRVLPALLATGAVELVGPPRVAADEAAEPERPGFRLTGAQQAALEQLVPALEARAYAPFLLYGATGSGKTEVYLRAADRALAAGRGVLYLVPEISLTPLLTGRINRRFPGKVAVLHSGLTPRQRFDTWNRVRRGERPFVVGTRSAVFAPVRELGLIVVDEEQDGSYKQEETPRYHGRDVALVRAREAEAVVLLGSATPSLESFHHARGGRYGLLRLGGRVEQRPLAAVQVVDMRLEFRRRGRIEPLSQELVAALHACLHRGEQALVLRNRRGWAAAVLCPKCGLRVGCDRCSITLTWHRSEHRLRCHYCEHERPWPDACPTCGNEDLKLLGEGTERIEDELRSALPDARIARLDRDTTRRRGVQEAVLRDFEAGRIDVLLGTQMIAKGHDFPRVTLVGVLSSDQALGLPDFRAGERVFQLLTQVAGRAGRGERAGTVVIQAFDPGHPVVRLAARQDYEAFFEREIRYRRALRYPPLAGIVELVVSDRDLSRAREWAGLLAEALRETGRGRLLLSGPGPAPIERLRGMSRQQILARSTGRRRLVQAVDAALSRVEDEVPARAIQVDVDPLSLL